MFKFLKLQKFSIIMFKTRRTERKDMVVTTILCLDTFNNFYMIITSNSLIGTFMSLINTIILWSEQPQHQYKENFQIFMCQPIIRLS